MDINELFDKLQENFLPRDLNGELILHCKNIVWSYSMDNNIDEFESITDYDDETEFNFDKISPEELLLEVYNDDLEKIQEFFDKIEETNNWTFSEPTNSKTVISFKIHQ